MKVKSKILIVLMVLFSVSTFAQRSDLTHHNLAGNIISTGVSYGMYKLTDKPALSVLGGFAAGCLVGILKEAYDKQQGRTFDNYDLAATIWGSAIGAIIVIPIIDINKQKQLKFI